MNKDQFTTIDKLTRFVNEKPRLNPADYADSQSYNRASKEITRDRNDYFELLSLYLTRYEGKANEVLTNYLTEPNSERKLGVLSSGIVAFTPVDSFAVEYRKAACRILASLIRQSLVYNLDLYSGKHNVKAPIYPTSEELHRALIDRVSTRVYELYFN